MPLIPFPDVPMSAGVPAVPFSSSANYTQAPAAGFISNANGQNAPGFVSNGSSAATEPGYKSWSIVDPEDGSTVLQPDSMVAVEIKETSKISTYPLEGGGFAAYNKIDVPFQLRVTMSCGGQGEMTREDFLSTLGDMKAGVDLYTIVTAYDTYENANLIEYSVHHSATNGATLVVAECMFEEVRQNATASGQNTAQPSGSDPVKSGQVSLNNPSAYVSATCLKSQFQ